MTTARLRDARARISEGVIAWDRQDFEKALEVFRDVLDDHPGFADVHNRVGLCLAMLDRPNEALTAFDQALVLNPSYAEAHLNRGIVLTELARHQEAQGAFDEASRLDTRDGLAFPSSVGNQLAAGHGRLGDLYRVASRLDLAIEQYRAALEIRPRYLDIRARLAEVLVELERAAEAREELGWVLEENPTFTGARIRLGVVLHRLGDTAGAIREWQRCLDEDPSDLRPRAYLASVGAEPSTDGGPPPVT
jgi:tetratricopeptide (TPR) repeat protein